MDSEYGAIWEERGLLTAPGTPIKNPKEIWID